MEFVDDFSDDEFFINDPKFLLSCLVREYGRLMLCRRRLLIHIIDIRNLGGSSSVISRSQFKLMRAHYKSLVSCSVCLRDRILDLDPGFKFES